MSDLAERFSEDSLKILQAGAEHPHSHIFSLRSQSAPHRETLYSLMERGLTAYIGGIWCITDRAREAIGARSEAAVRWDWLKARTTVKPAAADAPREPEDSRSRYEYAAMKKCGLVAFVVVKHADRDRSIVVSRDGGATPRVCLPKSVRYLQVQPESTDDFLLVIFPQYLARKIFANDGVDLLGSMKPLTAEREWSDTERDSWERVTRAALRINAGIRTGGKKSRNYLHYGEVA